MNPEQAEHPNSEPERQRGAASEPERQPQPPAKAAGGPRSAWLTASPPAPPTAAARETDQALPAAPPSAAEMLDVLQRMQGAVEEMRGRLEAITREARHRDFSPARLIAAILQALVIGFFVAGLADWVYGAKEGPILVKLAFAAVLQLAALTGFVLAQSKR